MARLNFRLSRVLAFRESQLTEAIQELVRAETRVQSVDHAMAEVAQSRETALGQTVLSGQTHAADLRIAASYLGFLEEREGALKGARLQLQGHLNQARQKVEERHQAVDVLKRLAERHGAVARQDAARREQRQLDEVAGLQAASRRYEGGDRQ